MTSNPILHVKFVPFGKPRTEEKGKEGREFCPSEMQIQKTFLVNKAGKPGAVFVWGVCMYGGLTGINSPLEALVLGSPLVFQAAPLPPGRSQRPEGKDTLKPVL